MRNLDSSAARRSRAANKEGKGMPQVISYLRYSSAQQTSGDSIRRQTKASQEWAARNGYVIDESLRDNGVSAFRGTNAETGALRSILKRIDNNEIREGSILIIESLDRLSRNDVSVALELFLGIINRGVDVVTLVDERRYSRGANMQEVMYSLMILSRGNDESKTKSYRSKANWEKRRALAKKGELYSRRLPYWLYMEGDKIKVDKAKAKAIQYAFDLALKGFGIGTIVRKLNSDKIPCVGNGVQWYNSYVQRLFNEPMVYGVKELRVRDGKRRVVTDRVEGYFPQVISKEVWEQANALVCKRRVKRDYGRTNKEVPNVFKGLLEDGDGGTYTLFTVRRPSGAHRYIVPMRSIMQGGGWQYLRADCFEQAFFEVMLNNFFDSFVALEGGSNGRSQAAILSAELDKVEKQIADIEQELEDMTAPAAALRVIAKLEDKRKTLQAELRDHQGTAAFTDSDKLMASLERMASLLTNDGTADARLEVRGLLRQLLSSIKLTLKFDTYKAIGDCTIIAKNGTSIPFRFSYDNRKVTAPVKKLQSLNVEYLKPTAA